MKARVKETGKIAEVVGIKVSQDLHLGMPVTTALPLEEVELLSNTTKEDTAPCDLWEQRRYEVSKDALLAIINSPSNHANNEQGDVLSPTSTAVREAIDYADELIKRLKETGQ